MDLRAFKKLYDEWALGGWAMVITGELAGFAGRLQALTVYLPLQVTFPSTLGSELCPGTCACRGTWPFLLPRASRPIRAQAPGQRSSILSVTSPRPLPEVLDRFSSSSLVIQVANVHPSPVRPTPDRSRLRPSESTPKKAASPRRSLIGSCSGRRSNWRTEKWRSCAGGSAKQRAFSKGAAWMEYSCTVLTDVSFHTLEDGVR